MIEVKNIYKSFGKKQVLSGVSFKILNGKTFTIIGGSGQGKSVIIKHIFGLLKPDSGDILVDGNSILNLTKKELFQIQIQFGIVFQGAALFDSLTVRENIGFGLHWIKNLPQKEIDKIVIEKLKMVDLPTDICNQKPSELSGGMRKRVGIARAIAYDPKYILYDEPTTGLDPVTSDVINNLILRLQKDLKITSIVVTHDMKTAYKVSDSLVMIDDGKVVQEGTPDEIKNTTNSKVRHFIEGIAE